MKTIKIVLSLVGFALTTVSFGQLLAQSDGSILFYTVKFNDIDMHLEHHLEEYPVRAAFGDQYNAPMAARTYFAPMEVALAVESWMTTPFESNYYETGPFIEPWMTLPFKDSYREDGPEIESWMTRPFDTDDEIEVEEWMRTSWI